MTDMSAVAALPGGQALVSLESRTRGDPAAIRAIATRWRKAATTSSERLEALGGALTQVDVAWKGASADAFVTYMRRYGRAGDALHDALGDCANCLDTAASAVDTARKNVGGVCDDLLAWVAEYRRRNPHATEEQLKPGIGDQVKQAVSLAQGHVDTAETTLSTARRDIDKYLGDVSPAFSDIPAAGDQSFVPGPGHTTYWVPVPESEIDPALYSGPGGGSSNGGGGFGGYGASGPPPPGGGPAPKGQVADWIRQAVEILRAQGYPVDKMNADDIWMIIQHESGGNPHAINTWDSNAAAGHPSKGLMQTIDPTFDRWSLPGHKDVYNPVDNIIAAVRYAIERYGSVSGVPGVRGTKNGSGYVGY